MPTSGPIRGQIRLFELWGITVYLHWSWFLVAVFEIQARAGTYSRPGWNVAEYLALFAIVTMHEFGHAMACRSVGGTPDRIMLWPFGGVAYVDPPQRPGAMLWSLAAGPLVNVALLPVLWLAAAAGPPGTDLARLLTAVEYINIALLVFNLLPIYPLDGGQILRSLLWYGLGRARSLMAAAVIGLAGVAVVGFLAIRTEDVWLLAISAYIAMNCWTGFQHARALWRLSKLPRRAEFHCPSCHAAPPIGVYWRCGHCRAGFDRFDAIGACPSCHVAIAAAPCVDCGRSNSIAAWRGAITTQFVD